MQRRDLEAFGREKVFERQISSRGSVGRGNASRRWARGRYAIDVRPAHGRGTTPQKVDHVRRSRGQAIKLAGDRFAAARRADAGYRKAWKKRAKTPTCDRSVALVRLAMATIVRADPTVQGGRGPP